MPADNSPEETSSDDFEIIDVPYQSPNPPSLQAGDRCQSEAPKEDISQIYFNVDDIESLEQLRTLSVKQLKLILTRNFIDYKGCLEREELLGKAERLWNDRHDNRQSIRID